MARHATRSGHAATSTLERFVAETTLTTLVWLGPAIGMLAISGAYYLLDRDELNTWSRFWVSAHGALGAGLYLGALVIWAITHEYRPWAGLPYVFLYLLPLASIIYALFRFRGPRWLHLTQVLNVAFMWQTWFAGAMAITGDWL